MTIRIASLTKQIKNTGARLHQAMLSRVHSQGAEQGPSEAEEALSRERRQLKQTQAQRQAKAKLPKAKPVQAVKVAPAPKAPKARKEPKPAKE
ncbi:MAG: hypothetical protein M3Y67_04410, partial [Pseudomonadota bacterium]|nr:hypothetical protein [Pseudomonadota bacterium]